MDEVQAKWKKFALYLQLDESIIEAIEKSKQHDVSDCCYEICRIWLQGSGLHPPTWNKLIEVLHRFPGTKTLADDLRMHCIQ